jgi:hypothetical protein
LRVWVGISARFYELFEALLHFFLTVIQISLARMTSLNSRERDRLSRPYFLELGKLVFAWNVLHDQLGAIFTTVFGNSTRVGLGVWHSVQSDRTQRKMLRIAVSDNVDPRERTIAAVKCKDILWLVDQVNNLADKRNSAIHSSYTFFTAYGSGDSKTQFIPNFMFGNPRASKLKDKDLLKELRWYRQQAEVFYLYAFDIWAAMAFSEPWPDRPVLPSLGQKKSRQKRPR